MLLTIGMASTNDFDGTYFTVQNLRLHHRSNEFEIVIVDNAPGTPHSESLKALAANAGVKHILQGQPLGTSTSRNRVIKEAAGEWVMCIDSHVIFRPETIITLLDSLKHKHWLSRPDLPINTQNLYTGPMLMDDLQGFCTHFNVRWREEMLGIWGRAWQCNCSRDKGTQFSLVDINDNGRLITGAVALVDGKTPIKFCQQCKRPFPILDWHGHERAYEGSGYYPLGLKASDPPFIIPAQGLGCFLTRKDQWLGFTDTARGFGGEEVCVHDLYRQAGRQTECLPFLKWLHKFGRPNGLTYPLLRYHKARNYVLWYNRLGKPVDEIKEHFVDSGRISVQEWEYLMENPIAHENPPVQASSGCGSCNQPAADVTLSTLDMAFDFVKSNPRDLNQHVAKLRELADECDVVTDISIRRESLVAFAASKAKFVHSFNAESDAVTKAVAGMRGVTLQLHSGHPAEVGRLPEPSDLVFLNTRHTGTQVARELEWYADMARRYIVLHNTSIYGETGEDGSPGIMPALRAFMRTNPKWSIVYHTGEQYGLTVLSCNPEDKPKPPSVVKQGMNFARAAAAHIASGGGKVELPVYEERLNICTNCDQRTGDDGLQCAACGCNVEVKASWPTSECPLARWGQAEAAKS